MSHHRTRQHALAVVMGMQVLLREVVHYVRWLRSREEADAGTVAEEAKVAIVCYDVHWRGVCGVAGCGGGAGAVIVDGADVAAVEADAGAVTKHGFVGRVGGVQGDGRKGRGTGEGAERGVVGQCEGGYVEGPGRREVSVGSGWKGEAGYGRRPGVVHGCEAVFMAVADAFPDSVFGCDEVGETFADAGEASEGGDIGDGGAKEYLGEDLRGNARDGARRW